MKKSVIAALAGTVVATSIGIGGFASAMDKAVTLSIDGEPAQVHVWGSTVQDALDKHDIVLTEYDEVSPAASDRIADGSIIEINYGRPITVIVDGVEKTFWTTATTVAEALKEIGLHDRNARLSVDRSLPLGRDGLTFSATTPKDVTVHLGEEVLPARSTAADIAGLLAELDIAVDSDDRINHSLADALAAGMVIEVQRVEVKEVAESHPIDFETHNTDDPELARGTTRVTVEGQQGEKSVIVEIVYVEGVEESRSVLREEVITEPVTKQVSVGTKQTTSTASAGTTSYSGTHEEWMAAAGISPSDYSAVEILVQRESSWNPSAVNPTSGACGLTQAWPCSKIGPNWSDPVVALAWGDQYVKGRYGSWQAALAHSYSVGWY